MSGCPLVDLALALSGAPVTCGQLVDWQVGTESEVAACLADAVARGLVRSSGQEGAFEIADESKRLAMIGAAGAPSFRSLAIHRALVPGLVFAARALREQGKSSIAAAILQAIFASPVAPWPGGERDWLLALLESVRTARPLVGVATETLEQGLAVAESCGDLAGLSILLAARGLGSLELGNPESAHAFFAQAQDRADLLSSQTRRDVYSTMCHSQLLHGRLRDGIAVFERLLGDVPDAPLASGAITSDHEDAIPGDGMAQVALAYACTGRAAHGLDFLHRFRVRAEQQGSAARVAAARLHLAWMLAHTGKPAAQWHAELAWEYFAEKNDAPWSTWHAAVTLAWALAVNHQEDGIGDVLRTGLAARQQVGAPPFCGSILFELDRYVDPGRLRDDHGLDLWHEADRAIAWPNALAAGAAHGCLARLLGRGPASAEREQQVADHLEQEVACLRESGATILLVRALAEAAAHAEATGSPRRAALLRAEESTLQAALGHDGEAECDDPCRDHLVQVILDVGRLDLTDNAGAGFWGGLAARLVEGLGLERVALLECAASPRLLAVRGGDMAWREELISLYARAPTDILIEKPGGIGQRIVVPLGPDRSSARGVAVLENRYTQARVASSAHFALTMLRDQLGIVLENVASQTALAQERKQLCREIGILRKEALSAWNDVVPGACEPILREALISWNSAQPVLLLGEYGSGKSLFARHMHRRGLRSQGPFIAASLAKLSPESMASILFGPEGMWLAAQGGTLFLDEVGMLSADAQSRLLRLLPARALECEDANRPEPWDCHLIASSNRDLEALARAGDFSEDLLSLIGRNPIRLPPLREHPSDIPSLARQLARSNARLIGRHFDEISEADMNRLCAYSWPGNLRELEYVIERAVVLSGEPKLRIPELVMPETDNMSDHESGRPLPTLEEVERRHIAEILRHTHGRITGPRGAAEILGLNPSTLNWRIDKLGLREIRASARAMSRASKSGPTRA